MSRLLLVVLLCSTVGSTIFAQKKSTPHVVRVGLYLNNLYDLNMSAHSFYADFYVWFKWRGDFDPTNVEFVNSIEKWSVTNTALGSSDSTSIVTLRDGSKYRILRIEGRFFHAFSLGRFPLDRHELDIQIENPEADRDSLLYLPDTARSAMIRPSLALVGWDQNSVRLDTSTHDYGTNFGNAEENAQRYSNLRFAVTLDRPFSFFLLKMLLPLTVVMLVSLGALLLHPMHIDTRSALPIGGLLTAVYLQQSYNDALPDSGYMVLMDKIYLMAYVLISLILLHVIVAGNVSAGGDDRAVSRIDRRERWLSVGYFGLFLLSVVVLCW
jgi:hypothetical protein